MAISRSEALTMLTNELGEDDAATTTLAGQALDLAQRDVARAHPWPELFTQAFVNTSDDYSTGTVALTNGDETVTLTGGTFPTTVVTRLFRFALSAGSQWYGVATRTDDTHIELSQAYVGTTTTSTSYVLYRNTIVLVAAVDRVGSIWLHNGTTVTELEYVPSAQWLMDFGHFPTGLGPPTHYTDWGRDSSGVVVIMVGPQAPDAEYRLEYTYRAKVTDGSFSLSEPLIDLVICRAQAIMFQRDHFQRYLLKMREYREMLREEIYRSGDVENPGITLGAGRLLGVNDYLTDLMDYGTVDS